MFISIPKDFFVPVLFSKEFRYNFESDAMEYDTERKIKDYSYKNSRDKLADIEERIYINSRGETEDILEKELKNIEDEIVEEQILNYVKGFVRYMEELRESGCLIGTKEESMKLLNMYVNKFRDLYKEYKDAVSKIRRPLSKADIDGMIDYYIGKIEDVYNKHLASLNCKNLNYDNIEKLIDEIVNDAKDILKEHIKNLNCKLINVEETCESYKELKDKFDHASDIYNMIDNEFVEEIQDNMPIKNNESIDIKQNIENNYLNSNNTNMGNDKNVEDSMYIEKREY